jgi:hypothetical protein
MPPKSKKDGTPTAVDRLTPATEAAGLTPHGPTPTDGLTKKNSGTAGQRQPEGLPPLGAVANVAKVATTGRKRRKHREPTPPPAVEPPPDPFTKRVERITDEDAAVSAAVLRAPTTGDEFDDLILGEEGDRARGSVEPTMVVKDTSNCNPHFLVAALILLPSLYFIALFGVYVSTPEGKRPLQPDPANAAILAQLTSNVVEALLKELEQGTRLASMQDIIEMDSSGRSIVWLRRPFYTDAQQRSNKAIEEAIRFSTNGDVYSQMREYAGGITISESIDIASLERARAKVLIGGKWIEIIELYDSVLHRVLLFQSAIALRNVDAAGLSGYQQLFATGQLAASDLLRMFVSYQNSTSRQPGLVINSLNSSVQYEFIAKSRMMIDTYEGLLRYAASGSNAREVVGSAPFRAKGSPVNFLTVPSATDAILDVMLEESFGSSAVYYWNSANETRFMNLMQNTTTSIYWVDSGFARGIPDGVKPARLVAELACLVLLFVLSVIAIFFHTKSSVQYYQNMEAHMESNRNATLFHRSLTRTSKFLLMAASLDVEKMAAVFRKVAKTSHPIPVEESQLYTALGSLRDAEPFLCNTVVAPPPEVPAAAISKHKLFVRPALVHVRCAVVLRVSLSPYHNAFAGAGVKQKALQHQMNRYLSLVQDTADALFGPRGTVLSVFADYAALWCNVLKKVDYPVMMATELALTVLTESTKQGIVASAAGEKPLLSICCGDALIGQIFNQPPGGFDNSDLLITNQGTVAAAGPTSSPPPQGAADPAAPAAEAARYRNVKPFGCFVSFGPVTKEVTLMTSLSKLHEPDISMNHWAAEAFHYEREALHSNGSTGVTPVPINVAATPARPGSASPARGTRNVDSPLTSQQAPVAGSARRDQQRNAQQAALQDRLRNLSVSFTPLDLIRADVVEDETAGFLRTANVAGPDRILHARAVDSGTELIPCYSVSRTSGDAQVAMVRSWDQFFAQFVSFVVMPTTANGDAALQLLETFLATYPQAGLQRTAERLRKAIGIGRVTGTVPITASQIKRARLAANLQSGN